MQILKRTASDNEYFHTDFHVSADQGLSYLGNKYGGGAVREYLEQFARAYYGPLIEEIKKEGPEAFKRQILRVYETEKALDAVRTHMAGDFLSVEIDYCPAVRSMKSTGHTPSEWYIETTATVQRVIAEEAGYDFFMGEYDGETGKTSYTIQRRKTE